jgi:lysophospholipase L1-like esterase
MKFRHLALAAALVLGTATPGMAQDNWLGAWGFVPTPPPPGMTPTPGPSPTVPLAAVVPIPAAAAPNQPLLDNPGNVPVVVTPEGDPANVTVRQLVRVAIAGDRIRLRFTNEAGADVLVLGAVRVGIAGPDGSMIAGTDRAVMFDGRSAVAIPAASPLLSDPVNLKVSALQKLVISSYVPGKIALGGHSLYQYVSGIPGDQTAAAQLPGQRIYRLTSLVSQVEVDAATANAVIVTMGDSITEGALSTNNAFRSYPDRLAERLVAARSKWSVVNAGIGGNRLLRHGTGHSALARFDRDVLGVPGVKAVILLEGINDIGRGFTPTGPQEPVTLDALIAANKQIIARARAHGIKVYGGLLTPYQGAGYASPAGEQVRTGLNNWIRSSGAFDGVIDFATATADKSNPLTFAAEYNVRDKLHPNDAGYQAMANAVDLNWFK